MVLIDNACIKEFYVAWRKAVRRVLKIPADTQLSSPAVDGHVTFHWRYSQTFSIFCHRMPKVWLNTCTFSCRIWYSCRPLWLYTIGRNTLLCCSHFGRQFGRRQYVAVVMTLYADTIDLSVVNSCDWHTMQFLSEIINIREYSDLVTMFLLCSSLMVFTTIL